MEEKYKITTIKVGKTYKFRIEVGLDNVFYTWMHGNHQVTTIVPYRFKNKFSWLLQPYIGGKETYDELVIINSSIVKSNNKIFTIFDKN